MPKAVTQDAIPAQRSSTDDVEAVPRALKAVAGICAVESLIAIGYGLYLLLELAIGTPRQMGQAVATAVTVLIIALPLPLIARGMYKAKTWSRAPAMMLQLFALWTAYFMVEAKAWFGAVPTIAAASVALVLIFLPSSTKVLTRNWPRD